MRVPPASRLLALLLVGCMRAPDALLEVREPACFALVYDSLSGAAEPTIWPARVALLPGRDSGEVRSQPAPGDAGRFWQMFAIPGTATWHRAGPDSLALTFSNGFTSVTMDASLREGELRGVGTIHYDVITDDPKPRVRIVGRREACPSPGRPAA